MSNKYGPVLYLKLGMLPMVIVNDSKTAKDLLTVHDAHFAFRPPSQFLETYSRGCKGVIVSSGEYWKTMRRVATANMLSMAKVNSMAVSRESAVRNIICSVKKSSAQEVIELRDLLGIVSANMIMLSFFGFIPEGSARVVELVDMIIGSALNANVGELFPALKYFDIGGVQKRMKNEILPELTSLIAELVQQRNQLKAEDRTGMDNDVLDVLQNLQKDNTISEVCISAFLTDMIGAGIGTSQGVQEWIMAEVMSNPHIMQKAQKEIDNVVGLTRLVQDSDIESLPYVQAIVKEGLRLHPPVPLGVPHYNPKESTIAGYTIPAKTQVHVNIWAIGRDSAHWDDPETFKPERFLNSNINVTGKSFEAIPFSAGRRICVGYPLAMRAVPLVVATLLHAFDWESISDICLDEASGLQDCKMNVKLQARARPRLQESAYA